jgi:hypothetical protein
VPSLDLGKTPKFTIKKEKPQRKWRGILRVFCTTIFSQYIYIYIKKKSQGLTLYCNQREELQFSI